MSFNPEIKLKIAVDGPAGAGKSTVAREVARRLNLKYLDTGSMYRAVTLKLIREAVPLNNPGRIEAVLDRTALDVEKDQRVFLDGEDVTAEIRKPCVNDMVSQVSAISLVRRRLAGMQREIAARSPGIVMDGRDIASRVMPDANFKFYLDAALEERARRRRKEHLERGLDLSQESVIEDIKQRDRIDSERADSPLTVAPGVSVIDTTALNIEEVVEQILERIIVERDLES